jgi:hypothetical protein
MYNATPIDEGSELLLKKEEQKIIELQERAMQLIKDLSESNGDKPNVLGGEHPFVINCSQDYFGMKGLKLLWKNSR